jgi:hypothetical protein
MPALTGVFGTNVFGDNVFGAHVWAGDSPPAPDAPVIVELAPNFGTPDGGAEVAIIGTNFDEDAEVDFDGTPATSVTWITALLLIVVTPSHAAGAVTVTVTNPDTQSDTASFTYQEPIDAGGDDRRRRQSAAVSRFRG